MSSSSTTHAPVVRTTSFEDTDGVTSFSKREEDEREIIFDWSNFLVGDTISSVTYEDQGVTTSSTSNTTTATTMTVTGIGAVQVEITMASGRTAKKEFRFYDSQGGSMRRLSDYSGCW